jgi:hypothetical protein
MPDPMRRRPVLSLLLSCLAAPWTARAQPAPVEDAPLDLEALMARMAAVPERHEAFREERRLAALNFPLVMTGTLHYRRPAHLEKLTETPQPESLVVEGDRVELTPGNEPTQILDLARAPELRALVDAVRAPLSGDLAALRRSFAVRATGTPDAWVLEMQPLEPRAARFLRAVRLAGSGTNVRETLLLQANGDVHHMLTRPLP